MNSPFDTMALNVRERPLSSDLNQAQSQILRGDRDMLRRLFSRRAGTAGTPDGFTAKSGFIGDSFKATPTNPLSMALNLRPGFAFFDAPTDVPTNINAPTAQSINDLSPYKPLVLLANQLININAAPGAGQVRIDLIEVRYNRALTDSAVRGILDPVLQQFVGTSVFKTLQFDVDGLVGTVNAPAPSTAPISYVVGTPIAFNAGTLPTTSGPSPTPGYMTVCEVLVFGSGCAGVTNSPTTQITEESIREERTQIFLGGTGRIVVDVTFPTTAPSLAPTDVEIIEAPSGTEVSVLGVANGSGNVEVVLALPFPVKNTVTSVAVKDAIPLPGTNVGYFTLGKIAQFSLTQSFQGQLNNPAESFPQILWAIGQPTLVVDTYAQAAKLNGTHFDTDTLPASIKMTVVVEYEY